MKIAGHGTRAIFAQLFRSERPGLSRRSSGEPRRSRLFCTCTPGADLTALPELPELQSLAVGLPGLADLGFLDLLPPLETVWLTQCQYIEDYSPLLRFTGLRTLVLSGSSQLRTLRQLPSLEAVGSLSLAGSALGRGELDSLVGAAPNLIYLYLENCDWLDDLAPLARLKLQDLRIRRSSAVSDLRPLSRQNNLRFLDVSLTRVGDLTPLQGLTQLKTLRLTGCDAVADLHPVAALPNLQELRIEGIAAGTDLAPLARNRRVTVYIAAGQDVTGEEARRHRLRIS